MEKQPNITNESRSYIASIDELLSLVWVEQNPPRKLKNEFLLAEIYKEITDKLHTESSYFIELLNKAPNQLYSRIVTKRLRQRICEMISLLSIRQFSLKINPNCCLAYLTLLYGQSSGQISKLLSAHFTTSLSRASI